MFPKSVCRQNKRGQRRGQAIAFTRSLLTRWKMGERQGLWDEAVMAICKCGRKGPKDNNVEQREADVCRLVSLGAPGKLLSAWYLWDWRKLMILLNKNFWLTSPLIMMILHLAPCRRNHPLLNFPWNWYSNPCNPSQQDLARGPMAYELTS